MKLPDLTLTCSASDVDYFLTLGFLLVLHRGPVADLEIAESDRDLCRMLRRGADSGLIFYGQAAVGLEGVPAVFAAHDRRYVEARAAAERRGPVVRVASDGVPVPYELDWARDYYRALALVVEALGDAEPWLRPPLALRAQRICPCKGRGWFLAEDPEPGRMTITRCDLCNPVSGQGKLPPSRSSRDQTPSQEPIDPDCIENVSDDPPASEYRIARRGTDWDLIWTGEVWKVNCIDTPDERDGDPIFATDDEAAAFVLLLACKPLESFDRPWKEAWQECRQALLELVASWHAPTVY